MKVISLLQPWATLVVLGKKKIETRSFNTKHRGPILIHASKKMTTKQMRLCNETFFSAALEQEEEMHLGKIIGKVDIICTAVLSGMYDGKGIYFNEHGAPFSKQEIAFGDYTAGRYGWLLANAVKFTHQLEVDGTLGLWNLNEPICLQCGCTEKDACVSKKFGSCWWGNSDMNICSHCIEGVDDLVDLIIKKTVC